MAQNTTYLFQSKRLGFRNWEKADIQKMAAISSNAKVMEFFPDVQSYEYTRSFVQRMQQSFEHNGYCYYAVDKLKDGNFVGFIGIAYQTFESPYTPCVDIGWRLGPSAWGKGYATEGAKKCLEIAFNELQIDLIRSFAPAINKNSIRVMQKIGMQEVAIFNHPLLKNHPSLEKCAVYEIKLDNYLNN